MRGDGRDEVSRRTMLKAGVGVVGLVATWTTVGCRPAAIHTVEITEGNTVGSIAFKVPAGEARGGEHFKMRGVTSNTLDVKISGADTDGRLAVMEQIGQSPNGGPPLHIHPDQDELFYVLEGTYQFEVGGERFDVAVGDTIFLPRGVPHAFIQLSEAARMVVTYQPAGDMEAFFRATTALTAPLSKEEMGALFASHGMKVVGPPLTRA